MRADPHLASDFKSKVVCFSLAAPFILHMVYIPEESINLVTAQARVRTFFRGVSSNLSLLLLAVSLFEA
jgi:hypothetical protein